MSTVREAVTSPVNILIAANVAVAAIYYFNDDPNVTRMLRRHTFLTSRGVRDGHYEQLLLYAFMHSSPMHLLFNMMTLKSFGDLALVMLGSRSFTALYAASAVAGGCAHVLYERNVMRWTWLPASRRSAWDASCVGASGAILGVVSYVAARIPAGETVLLIFPVRNWILLLLIAGGSTYALYDGTVARGWGHAAHLGGIAVGTALALARRRLRY